jgi:peroxiredoxin
LPAVAALYREELLAAGVDVIGVSQFNTTEAASRDFVDRHELTFPNFYDPDAAVASAYGIRGVPSYVFLGKEGRIARTSSGARGVELIATVLNELSVE